MRPMPRQTSRHQTVALSAQLVELDGVAPAEIKLLPDGAFRSSRDHRPADVAAWVMNGEAAQAILAAQGALHSRFLIDYEHQTLRSEQNGKPAPAAGWSGRLEWREGDGLYATDLQWTEAALAAIAAKEYRYISPVIRYNPKTGVITAVPMAALVNYPALDGLNDLAAAAACLFPDTPEDDPMDEQLLALLRHLLKLPESALAADIVGELEKLKAHVDGSATGLAALLAAKDGEIAALTAKADALPDPARFVPVDVFNELQDKLAALSGQSLDERVEQLIEDAVNAHKVFGPKDKAWLIELGKKDLAALQGCLDSRQPLAALAGMQTGGKAPNPDHNTGPTADELAVCKALGVAPEAFTATKEDKQ